MFDRAEGFALTKPMKGRDDGFALRSLFSVFFVAHKTDDDDDGHTTDGYTSLALKKKLALHTYMICYR